MKKLSLFLFLATVGLQLSAVRPSYTPKKTTQKHELHKPALPIEKKPTNQPAVNLVTKKLAAMNLGKKTNLPPKPNINFKAFLTTLSRKDRRHWDF